MDREAFMKNYGIGVDFGTESGGTFLDDIFGGQVIGSAGYSYHNGLIDQHLPEPGEMHDF